MDWPNLRGVWTCVDKAFGRGFNIFQHNIRIKQHMLHVEDLIDLDCCCVVVVVVVAVYSVFYCLSS